MMNAAFNRLPMSKAIADLRKAKRLAVQDAAINYFSKAGLPMPGTEYQFVLDRKWRFDYCWPAKHVALEVEGGVWTGGRHTSGAGFVKDMEKYNRAVAEGWRVVRCMPSTLRTAETVELLRKLLN